MATLMIKQKSRPTSRANVSGIMRVSTMAGVRVKSGRGTTAMLNQQQELMGKKNVTMAEVDVSWDLGALNANKHGVTEDDAFVIDRTNEKAPQVDRTNNRITL